MLVEVETLVVFGRASSVVLGVRKQASGEQEVRFLQCERRSSHQRRSIGVASGDRSAGKPFSGGGRGDGWPIKGSPGSLEDAQRHLPAMTLQTE